MFFGIILSFTSFLFLLSTVESIRVDIENGTVEGLTQEVNGKPVYSFIVSLNLKTVSN